MVIYRSDFSSNRDRLHTLFNKHWKEIGISGSSEIALNLNEEVYKALEDANRYLAILADDEDGSPLGYLSIFIYEHYHHKGSLMATTDCFYIDNSKRTTQTVHILFKMFKLAEKILKEEYNVKYFQFTCSTTKDLTVLAERMGYQPSDLIFTKDIG